LRSEGRLLPEQGLIKDKEKLLPKNYNVIGGWVLNLAMILSYIVEMTFIKKKIG
jgi:hypothetical protein